MTGKHHDALLKIMIFINIILITVPFSVAWLQYYADRTWAPFYAKGNYVIIALFFLIYLTYGHVYDAFLVSLNRATEMVYAQSLAAFISDVILYVICWLLTKRLPTVWPMILVFIGQIVLSGIWSLSVRNLYFKVYPPRRTVVIYDARHGLEELVEEYGLDLKFDIQATISVKEYFESMEAHMQGIDSVFLCGIHSHERNMILKYCVREGIEVYVIPRIGDVLMSGAKRVHMLHLPILQVNRYNPSIEYVAIKRFMDIVVSGVFLIIFSPVMFVTAIAIKMCDKGPVFYKQCRLTKDGKQFQVLKFRSMAIDAEKDGIARLSTGENDDRITPVGRVIRKVRIDELPQLINILKGEMAIVGPRPERPEIAAQYEKDLPEFALRLQAKAGLTGYAQVYGKYNTTPYDKLQMDLMYIAKPSLLEDLRIIFATIKILFLSNSTEGIEKGKVTAETKVKH